MMTTVQHVTTWAGRTKYQADGFLLNRVYLFNLMLQEVPASLLILLPRNGFITRETGCFLKQIS